MINMIIKAFCDQILNLVDTDSHTGTDGPLHSMTTFAALCPVVTQSANKNSNSRISLSRTLLMLVETLGTDQTSAVLWHLSPSHRHHEIKKKKTRNLQGLEEAAFCPCC